MIPTHDTQKKRTHFRIAKPLIWAVVVFFVVFLFINVMAAFQAWNFTHFKPSTDQEPSLSEHSSFSQKITSAIFGVAIQKPLNTWVDPDFIEIDTIPGAINLEVWKLDMEPSKGVVLFYHGYKSSKSALWREALAIYRMGYSIILVDFRASGGSDGNTTTIGYYEANDVQNSFNYTKENYPEQKIYLYGTSMGAAAVMHAVSKFKIEPHGLILQSPFPALRGAIKNRFNLMHIPSWPLADLITFWGGYLNDFDAFSHNPATYAKQISCPTLLIHGMLDNRVSWEDSQEILKNIPGKKEFAVFSKSGHESILNHEKENWIYTVTNFFITHK